MPLLKLDPGFLLETLRIQFEEDARGIRSMPAPITAPSVAFITMASTSTVGADSGASGDIRKTDPGPEKRDNGREGAKDHHQDLLIAQKKQGVYFFCGGPWVAVAGVVT